MIFSKVEGLSYLGNGQWRAKCPVHGCKSKTLLIQQSKIASVTENSQIHLEGDFECESDCSVSEILDAFDIDAYGAFFNSVAFERDPEGYTCLLNRKESLAILSHDVKDFLRLLESLPFSTITHHDVKKYWYLIQGIRWFIEEHGWTQERRDIVDFEESPF